jgi:hypothetical protein
VVSNYSDERFQISTGVTVSRMEGKASTSNGDRGITGEVVLSTLARLQEQMEMMSNKMDEKFEMMSDRVNDSIESQANAKKAVEQKPVFKVVTSAAGQVIGHATAGTRGHPPHTATDRAKKN